MASQTPIELIPIGRLREMFNAAGLEHEARYGSDLYITVEADGHPSPPMAGEPFCTRSQTLAYRDDGGKTVASVHAYLRPDGSTGLGGRHDPKEMLGEDGIWYVGERYPDAEA